MMGWEVHGSGWLLMALLITMLLWGSLVAVGWAAARALDERARRAEPLDILAHRFARGEIGPDDYQRSSELLHTVA
jgi:uncharacterized membrane protein